MKNQEVAKLLFDIADVLEMQGVDFKPAAYRKAAQSVERLSADIGQLHSEGRLKDIPGVGEGIAKKIAEFLATGKLNYYEELKKQVSPEIAAMMEVPGMGPKRVKLLSEKLKIRNVDELERAAKEHRIRELAGFGEKSEEDILNGISIFKKGKERMLLGDVLPIAAELEGLLKPVVSDICIAGSIRRRKETVGDIDILVISAKPSRVMDFFTGMDSVASVIAKGLTKSSVILRNGLQVDLRVVKSESFGSAMQYFTGSKEHNIKLREIAIRKGWKLSEYGLFDGKKQLAGNEEDIYRLLGMQYIEPELREDTGEIEAALSKKLPKLIGYGSIKGDLHMHTTYSDGSAGIAEMAQAAGKLGYEYICITDHSKSERIANGLSEEHLLKEIAEIRKAEKKAGIRIFAGCEVDIKPDGSLDYDNNILKKLDIVIASVHSRFKSSRDDMTGRIVKALENPYVDILAHPTGRLINRRPEYEVDLERIFDAAANNNVYLEINSFPARLDLNDANVRKALEHNLKLVINTDSHAPEQLNFMELGIAVARRGWCTAKDIVNTAGLKELPKYFKRL